MSANECIYAFEILPTVLACDDDDYLRHGGEEEDDERSRAWNGKLTFAIIAVLTNAVANSVNNEDELKKVPIRIRAAHPIHPIHEHL